MGSRGLLVLAGNYRSTGLSTINIHIIANTPEARATGNSPTPYHSNQPHPIFDLIGTRELTPRTLIAATPSCGIKVLPDNRPQSKPKSKWESESESDAEYEPNQNQKPDCRVIADTNAITLSSLSR